MKICFIAGPGSIHTRRWATWFADRKHDVHIVFPESPFSSSDIVIDRVHMHPFKTMPILSPQSHLFLHPIDYFRLKKIVKAINPDIIHAHYLVNYGFRAACTGFHPLVVTVWGSDVLVDAKNSKVTACEVRYVLKQADLITCDAEHIIPLIIKIGANKDIIQIINFGIDTDLFRPQEKDMKLAECLGVAAAPVVISLRSLRPIYDIESLVRATPSVLKEVPQAKFIIAGDGEQRGYLEDLAAALDVSDSIRFIGQVTNERLPAYLNLADVYVSTSLSDAGLSASTAEAMACGLAVVVTDFGDNRKWVKDGSGGFIVPLRDSMALGSRIIELLQDGSRRRRFGQANRDVIRELMDRNTEMQKMERLYQKLV